LSNEEKTNDYENFEKGMIAFSLSNMYKYCYVLLINLYYIPDPPFFLHAILETALTHMRSEKEKGGGGNEIHAPCACEHLGINNT
jgi:glucose uptake protein GlcU